MTENIKDLALRLQSIIDTAIDGIITIDAMGIIETINQAAAEQFGYLPKEVIGNNIKILMPEPYHSEHDGYINRYLKTKTPHIIGMGREVTGKRKNGTQFPFRLAVSEVILNDRVIFTGIIHDMSEVKKAEADLRELNERLEQKVEQRTNELEEAVNDLLTTNRTLEQREQELEVALEKEKELNELKSRFVSMASHEFRTPLSTIMSSASLLSKYTLENQQERRDKHIDRIKSAVRNLTGILNDFLSLSKIEEGKIQINLQKITIEPLCQLVIDEVKGLLKEGQTIQHQHDESFIEISTDKHILKNILFNLLSNAIKYSPANSIIECQSIQTEISYQFIIKDQGIGIPASEQKHLFSRFFRASNVENIQGTGLGLSIVKRYIDLLGGKIQFQSQFGKGTTFTVSFPKV